MKLYDIQKKMENIYRECKTVNGLVKDEEIVGTAWRTVKEMKPDCILQRWIFIKTHRKCNTKSEFQCKVWHWGTVKCQ